MHMDKLHHLLENEDWINPETMLMHRNVRCILVDEFDSDLREVATYSHNDGIDWIARGITTDPLTV